VLTWRRLLVLVASAQAMLFLGFGALSRDRESIAFGVISLAAIALLHVRRGLLGDVLLTVVAVDVAGWLVPAAIDNVRHHDRFVALAVPSVAATIAVIAVVATIGHALARRRGNEGDAAPAVVAAIGATALLAMLVVASAVGLGNERQLPAGGVSLSARNIEYSTSRLTVASGTATVRFTNHDLFWHTFSVEGLDVDLKVPVGGQRDVTFAASPGTYTFYCSIPGHRTAGMEGTIVVTAS
jgi:plastocyanin